MSFGIASGFFLKVPGKGGGQIDPGLIRDTNQHKKDIGDFVGEIRPRFIWFETLIAAAPRELPGQFADFFHQLSQVRQFGEIPHADRLDPIVDRALQRGQIECRGHRIPKFQRIAAHNVRGRAPEQFDNFAEPRFHAIV